MREEGDKMSEDVLNQLREAIIDGNMDKTLDLARNATNVGFSGKQILEGSLIPGIRRVGELFNEGEYFLPELIVSGKCMSSAVDLIGQNVGQDSSFSRGQFLIGSVRGDVHDIGKNIVIMMLKANGWKVTDLGLDVSPEQFCSAVKEGDFDIVGMSALLTMTIGNAGATIKALEEAGLRKRIKVMIGGAPVTQKFADDIGADAYGSDAWDAVVKAEALMSKNA